MGSGFEFALACHHRIAIDNPKTKLGLPEVNIGLMTGGGASIRLLWLIGIEKAYEVLINKNTYNPREAKAVGIIDDLAANENEMMEKAKRWILNNLDKKRIWDTVPGTSPIENLSLIHISEPTRPY